MSPQEQRELYAHTLGRFLGATPTDSVEREILGDRFIVDRMVEIARHFREANKPEPGPVLVEGMPARTVYDHQLGKFMLDTVNYQPGVGYK